MNIGIVGVGNIGMRYLQGIRSSWPEASLWLVERDERLNELKDMDLGDVRLCSSVAGINQPLDLIVVATSSGPRLSLYKQCLALSPRYVILDKYLFSSPGEFDECLALGRVPTFVNQWMHGSGTFDCLFENGATTVEVAGSGWGLACNSVHWIDVLKRHMKIKHLQVGSETAVREIVPSKRDGYEEIVGELVFEDTDSDKSFRLVDQNDGSIVNMLRITVDDQVYTFDYSNILLGDQVLSHFPYFSTLIGGIVGDIIETGRSSLPSLEESISQHLLMEQILGTLDRRPRIT